MSADSDRSAWLKTALPDSCAIVVVRETSQVSLKLSTDTDVALVDAVSNANAVPTLTQLREENQYEFQVGVLTATEDAEPHDADAALPWSLSAEVVHDHVETLAAQAQYRRTLAEYYEVTVRLVTQQTPEDRSELRARRERLETRLDEFADTLDTRALYDAVLD